MGIWEVWALRQKENNTIERREGEKEKDSRNWRKLYSVNNVKKKKKC